MVYPTNYYHWPTFTGTEQQPDRIHCFIKHSNANNHVVWHKELWQSRWNQLGKFFLVGSYVGVRRIKGSICKYIETRKLKKEGRLTDDKQIKAITMIACKNLCRGIIEFLPLTGLPLMIYDMILQSKETNRIQYNLANKQNVIGIAFNNKILLHDLKVITTARQNNFISDKKFNDCTSRANFTSEVITWTVHQHLVKKIFEGLVERKKEFSVSHVYRFILNKLQNPQKDAKNPPAT